MTNSKIPRTAKIIAIPNRTIHKAFSIVVPYYLTELLWYNNAVIAVKAKIGMGIQHNVVLCYRLASIFILLATCSSEYRVPTQPDARVRVILGAICH
jgi:hypothetical protein